MKNSLAENGKNAPRRFLFLGMFAETRYVRFAVADLMQDVSTHR